MHPLIEKIINLASRGVTLFQRQREIIRNRATSLRKDPEEPENLVSQHNGSHRSSLGVGKRMGTYDFHNSGCIYEGELENGVAEGNGIIYYPNHKGVILYKGEFHSGNRHGMGVLFLEDGFTKCYEGQWKNDKMEGRGVFFWEDGVTKFYDGFHHDGYYEGSGTLYDMTGHRYYEGEFHNSSFDGKGTVYRNGIKLCEGEFSDGKLVRGALFKNGIRIYDGPLPPTEDGLIKIGGSVSVTVNDCCHIIQSENLHPQNKKYHN